MKFDIDVGCTRHPIQVVIIIAIDVMPRNMRKSSKARSRKCMSTNNVGQSTASWE